MNMTQHLRQLYRYDDWANHEVLASLRALSAPPPRSVKWLAHILSAKRLWLERLRQEPQTYPVWPDFSLEDLAREADELSKRWHAYLDSLTEESLARDLTYKNTKGESWTSQIQDILTHVVMHSAYHRGQIAADLRSAGFAPSTTDFIHAVRQGHLEENSK